ncbi:stathmin domain-containing protein 1 [Rhynochetos jubatus]
MGCNISNRVTVAQPSSEELQNHQEAKSQTKSNSIAGTEAVSSQDGAAWPTGTSKDGAKLEDETSEGDSPEEVPERFTSSQNSSSVQSTDALLTSKFIGNSRPLQETERQTSSDILEELKMQGIIKSQSTTARTGEVSENTRDTLEKTPKKPPSRLKKIQFGKKDVREKELNQMPQDIIFFPPTAHQTTGKETEKDSPSFGSQVGTDTPQPLPLGSEPGILLKERAAVKTTNNYTEDSLIKSDNLQLHQ